jgi:hypothetical protein
MRDGVLPGTGDSVWVLAARLVAYSCRRAHGIPTPLHGSNDLEGRGRVIAGDDRRRLEPWLSAFSKHRRPDGSAMGALHDECGAREGGPPWRRAGRDGFQAEGS